MDLSHPAAKKLKLSSAKQIGDLADADLEEVFKRLPPLDRLTASEVCRRWNEVSRKAWLDVTQLDLGPIPGQHIGAILSQCPNLRSVFAREKSFNLNELAGHSYLSQLSTVKLFDCKLAVKGGANFMKNVIANMFSEDPQQSSWNELVLHDVDNKDETNVCGCRLPTKWAFFSGNCRAALTRLQLSDVCVSQMCNRCVVEHSPSFERFLKALDQLQNLECFIFHGTRDKVKPSGTCDIYQDVWIYDYVLNRITALKHLREVCIGPAGTCIERVLGRLISRLPRLEVLFLNHVNLNGQDHEADLKDLVVKNSCRPVLSLCEHLEGDPEDLAVKNSALRLLVLSGIFYQQFDHAVEIPARKRFANGFGSDPLPLLHIFVGKEASERIRFEKSTSDALIVYPINEPMPQFLERADIAPIFEGVWIAEKIKDTARNGGKLCNYELSHAANSVQYS